MVAVVALLTCQLTGSRDSTFLCLLLLPAPSLFQ